MSTRSKILVIDDETKILKIIDDVLSDAYDVLTATNGEDGLAIAQSEVPDLIVVDKIMPKMDGVLVAQFLRKGASTKHIPIIMLTALKEPPDRTAAFNAGIDDFISKPFHPDELVARIESKIGRFKSLQKPERVQELRWQNLRLLPEEGRVFLDNSLVRLTPIEFAILHDLISNVGKVRSREKIVAKVWGKAGYDVRLLDSHVASLRRKMKHLSGGIETIYGRGYRVGN